ncbi:hypothetical protein OIY81_2534 [Cryptosporidium canis]|nr:hypothetical protein OIY81_2534 [Cryptosporidium canis]
MRKSVFCFALILLFFFPVCSLGASNFDYDDDGEVNGRNLIILLNTYIRYLNLLKRFASCLQNYNILTFKPMIKVLNYNVEQCIYHTKLVYYGMDPSEHDPSIKTKCAAELDESFNKLNEIISECINGPVTEELVSLLTQGFGPIHRYLHNKLKKHDWSNFLAENKVKLCEDSLDAVSTACMASLRMLHNSVVIKRERAEARLKLRERKEKKTKQLSESELQEAEKLANLNAHIAIGCCTDGSCGSLEGTGKTKSKRSGKKKQKNLAQQRVAETNDQLEPKEQRNQVIEEAVEVLNLLIKKLIVISEEEFKLRVHATSYNGIYSDITRHIGQSTNEGLICRANMLPESVSYDSDSYEEKNNKCVYLLNSKKMAAAAVCGCTNNDCKIKHMGEEKAIVLILMLLYSKKIMMLIQLIRNFMI